MKCLIDTNILISTSLFPASIVAEAYAKATSEPFHAMVCDYSINEMRRVYNRKFPNRITSMDRFLALLLLSVEVVITPPEELAVKEELAIRDTKDRSILRSAIISKAEYLLTGDKDFLESGLRKPIIIAPSDFLKL